MTARRLTVLAAMAGLLTLAACGEQADPIQPASAQAAEGAALPRARTLEDVTSNLPATDTTREAAAFPPYGSPWYPTPAADVYVDPCFNQMHVAGKPQPC